MKKLSLKQLDRLSGAYNSSVAAFPGIDFFCTRADWIIPYCLAFTPENRLGLWQSSESFVALSETRYPDGQVFLTPLEGSWGFASALVGPDSPDMFCELLKGGDHSAAYRRAHFILSGLPDDCRFLQKVADVAAASHQPFLLKPTHRCVSSLAGGVDGFLQRRSKKFRANLNKALRSSDEQDITFRRIDSLRGKAVANAYLKILDVERRSWKGQSGSGADQPPMKEFYELMLKRIAPAGSLRLIMAERAGENIGYIYGACIGRHYRGLQFSFDARFSALSPGNVLQYHMIQWLCDQGCARYDLGSLMPYKKKWAEINHTTLTLYLRPA